MMINRNSFANSCAKLVASLMLRTFEMKENNNETKIPFSILINGIFTLFYNYYELYTFIQQIYIEKPFEYNNKLKKWKHAIEKDSFD